MPSVSRPAPACRHPGCESWLLKLFLLNLVRCPHAGMPDVRLYLLNLCRRRHAGMPDIKLCMLGLKKVNKYFFLKRPKIMFSEKNNPSPFRRKFSESQCALGLSL